MRFAKQVLATSAVLALLSAAAMSPAPALAGPALQWWHFTPGVSQSECVKRARKAWAVEKMPVRHSGSDFLTGYNSQTTATVKCMKVSGKTMAVVIVTSNDAGFARYLMEATRDGIKTGVFH